MKQAPSSIFMVRPEYFGYNVETAQSNAFQNEILISDSHKITKDAIMEFECFVELLRAEGIDVHVFNSPIDQHALDAVFPNNWISFHANGTVILYPMLTKNRRIERRREIVETLSEKFIVNEIIDISDEEKKGRILEGTGSIIFDRHNLIAYANGSPRTDKQLFYDVCQKLGYEGVFFKATDERGIDIYHTNVMMMIGAGFVVICKEAIDKEDRARVINNLEGGGLDIIEISFDQMNHFAGNMIHLQNQVGDNFLVLSDSAYKVLNNYQKDRLSNFVQFIHPEIDTIETIGGGSARCMISGIYLQRR